MWKHVRLFQSEDVAYDFYEFFSLYRSLSIRIKINDSYKFK